MRFYIVRVTEIRAEYVAVGRPSETVTVKLAGEDFMYSGVETVIPGWRGDVKIGQQFRLSLEERPW